MRRALALLALPLVAACGAPGAAPPGGGQGEARPARAILYADTLTVEMSDRGLCTGPRRASGRVWSGRLAGCAQQWAYSVELPPYRIARLPLKPGEGGAGRAEITAPDGTVWVYSGPR